MIDGVQSGIEKYVTDKMNFNKLFAESKIDPKLIKYLPKKPQKKETNEKIRKISSRNFS